MRTMRKGDSGPDVLELTEKLVELNILDDPSNEYTTEVRRAVKVFQSTNLDPTGSPLGVDGVAGRLTQWSIRNRDLTQLFERPVSDTYSEMPDNCDGSELARTALQIAIDEMNAGAQEIGGNNQGPFVAKYHRISERAAAQKSWSWCAAFTSYCFSEASLELGEDMPFVYTGGAQNILKQLRRKGLEVDLETDEPQTGDVIVWKRGSKAWQGHVGIVYDYHDGVLWVIEGNRGAFPAPVRVYQYVLSRVDKILGLGRIP
jgi:hypothetical protein